MNKMVLKSRATQLARSKPFRNIYVRCELGTLSNLSKNLRLTAIRAFQTSCCARTAHEFSMPALSPTMTEGNITGWKVKEGAPFIAGDVLLEVETDKAQMDVEAQEDGIMARIIERDGAKGVKVGARIAITADPEDDIDQLDFSSFESLSSEAHNMLRDDSPVTEKSDDSQELHTNERIRSDAIGAHDRRYPLFPSVAQLLHERGISEHEISQIPVSGPNGRLLKGDVLAYLGRIDPQYPVQQSKRLQALSHLNLNNIEIRQDVSEARSVKSEVKDSEAASAPTLSEVSLPISLTALEELRHRMRNTLGVDISLSELINRATTSCNRDLPLSAQQKVNPELLFDAILDSKATLPTSSSVGNFKPLFYPLDLLSNATKSSKHQLTPRQDIIDELILPIQPVLQPAEPLSSLQDIPPASTRFSVAVIPGDEQRAKIFLQRLKTSLQSDPGSLLF